MNCVTAEEVNKPAPTPETQVSRGGRSLLQYVSCQWREQGRYNKLFVCMDSSDPHLSAAGSCCREQRHKG